MLQIIKKCTSIIMAVAMITTVTNAAVPLRAAALESSTKLAAPSDVVWGRYFQLSNLESVNL